MGSSQNAGGDRATGGSGQIHDTYSRTILHPKIPRGPPTVVAQLQKGVPSVASRGEKSGQEETELVVNDETMQGLPILKKGGISATPLLATSPV